MQCAHAPGSSHETPLPDETSAHYISRPGDSIVHCTTPLWNLCTSYCAWPHPILNQARIRCSRPAPVARAFARAVRMRAKQRVLHPHILACMLRFLRSVFALDPIWNQAFARYACAEVPLPCAAVSRTIVPLQSLPELKPAPRMSDSSSLGCSRAFYSSTPVQSLFARELRALEPIVSGVYGNHGLFLHAHAAASIAPPPHLLGTMVSLELVQQQLAGDLRCEPAQLPFVSESFKLLIAQHVLEQIDRPRECVAELSRVLAPEGIALILGFNPMGSWRPWLMLNAPRGASRLHLRSAHAWQQMLAGEQIETLQMRYPGVLWPRAEHPQAAAESTLLGRMLGRIGSSWLLLARKRRSTLTPLRLRSGARELALNPRLAPGAHRARA